MQDPLELCTKICFPLPDNLWQRGISDSLRKATLELREAYYKASPTREDVYKTPFGGPITDSIGTWPEFILRGLPCQKSKKGCCTPCFYSRIPQVSLPPNCVYQSLVQQTAYILENFETLVRDNQHGPVAFPNKELPTANNSPLAFVLTPTGSFFEVREFPPIIREKILNMLVEHSQKIGHPLVLHIETHAEDFINAADESTTFQRVIELLKALNGRVIFGFESASAFVRNVLYNKYLNIDTFDDATKRALKQGLGVGAFVFIGINPLTDVEIIADAVATLDFLKNIGISPVLMFHNIQPYTVQELLFCYKAHRLPEPRTVLEVVRYLVTAFPECNDALIDAWLIADPVGGPPPPKYNIFSSEESLTCKSCSDTIYSAVVSLRTTRNSATFLKCYENLSKCECATKYYELLSGQVSENSNLQKRVEKMVKTIKQKRADYVSVVRPIINETEEYTVFDDQILKGGCERSSIKYPKLKAELLCYGLNIDNQIESELVAFNSYVQEAGFVHAAHFLVGGKVVNACVAEQFCKASPYLLTKRNGQYALMRDKQAVVSCEIMRLPDWCSEPIADQKMGDVLRPHSPSVVSGMPSPKCCYFETGNECRFCSLGPLQELKPVEPAVVAEVALFALKYNPSYELALSGGTPASPDRGALYFLEISNLIRKNSQMPISVELVPPVDNSYIDYLFEAGVTSVIMNIEVWDQSLRTVFCPGKCEVSIERYEEAIRHAVKRFGRGQVASVLISGLQEKDTLLAGAKHIIGLGAIPTIIPFKPFDACKLSHFPRTNPLEILTIYHAVSYLLGAEGLNPNLQRGCTGCGGCSLENLTFKK